MTSLASVTSPNPAAASATEDRYSTAFPLYEEADLVVRSSDGTLFATEKLYLQAISPVFKDTLKIGSAPAGEREDGRPVLQLTEGEEDVEFLLRLAQHDRYTVNGQQLELSFEAVRRASLLADKYDLAPVLQDYLFGHVLGSFIPTPKMLESAFKNLRAPAMAIFALGCIHHREHVVRSTLRALHIWGEFEAGSTVFTHDEPSEPAKMIPDWRYRDLGDLELDLAQRVPLSYLLQFAQLHRKVITRTDYSFLKAADDWKM